MKEAGSVVCGATSRLEGLTDKELAVRIQQGCRAAFDELVDRYGPRLLRFLVRRTGNPQDAEDLVQETFVRVYRYADRYCPNRGFSTWLFTIAARLASTHHRHVQASLICPNAEDIVEPSPLDQLAQREDKTNLWILAKTLPERQYEVLWLRYAEAMTVQEIAGVTGRSQIHVRVLLFRARATMAKKIQALAGEGSCAESWPAGRGPTAELEGD